jgi:hypothetical protein
VDWEEDAIGKAPFLNFVNFSSPIRLQKLISEISINYLKEKCYYVFSLA